ncbi:CorA family divalent cation transporter [Sphingomonas abietis]|uniref:Magnesium transporter n=1 Tax=Sphingomonas abietis TaxID=3012344 RepID=A0ABY7NQQ5_9SPHN|nr:CorA family divalent cation transporter [Sphingomonas abietis]WBO22274.1 magnesium transporter [Sphingomonas abietis]
MLKLIGKNGEETTLDQAIWADLCEPTDEEIAQVEKRFEVHLPTRAQLSEIEASSRLRSIKGRLIMSAPLIARHEDIGVLSPTGFLLLPDALVTVRFCQMTAFDQVLEAIEKGDHAVTGQEILVRLLEDIVDRSADRLERVAEELASASHAIFREPEKDSKKHRLGHETRRLRGLMVSVGLASEQMVKVRHAFLAIGRIASFVLDRCEPKIEQALHDRLVSVKHDIESLDEFENSLTGRVGLLIDAATGFISIEQNDVVKVLTVVSVAGVPPVLIAGVYGMNFHNMPELAWPWGYPFAIALMVLSTILPVWWFKYRDWM